MKGQEPYSSTTVATRVGNGKSKIVFAERAADERVVTVLVADLSGSTALGERLDPEELRAILGAYFRNLSAEIQRFGGRVEKFIGDAIRAEFEARTPGASAGAALGAGLAMLDALRKENETLQERYNVRLALRVGVNTGPVLGETGQPLVGETADLAQRFEHAAPLNSV